MARYPIDNPDIPSAGSGRDFGVWREAQKVWHWGMDIGGPAGANVRAPEDGVVVDVYSSPDPERSNNTSMIGNTDLTRKTYPGIANPWDGYGPGGVLLQGASGVWHLLAHTIPEVSIGDHLREGDRVGHLPSHVGAAGPHTHWEVRTQPLSTLGDRKERTTDPRKWIASAGGGVVSSSPRAAADAGTPARGSADSTARGARRISTPVIVGIGAGLLALGLMIASRGSDEPV